MQKFIEKIYEDDVVKLILPFINGKKVYLVGGFLRDLICQKQNFDKDLIVDEENIEEFAKKIAENLNATFIELDKKNQIYRLVLKDKKNYIDIAKQEGSCLLDDIKRRDFTINSLIFDFANKQFIDKVGAINDIENKIIRENCEMNFIEDSLRLLRVFRFQSNLGFKINENLKNIIRVHKNLIKNSAKERINQELSKLFEGKFAFEALCEADKLGFLEIFFPEINEIKKIPKNQHHHLDLFHHSVETVKVIQEFYEKSDTKIKNHFINKDLGENSRLSYLKLAGFLHDIGKPQTWRIEKETQRHRFIKHEEVGSKIVVDILKRLNYSKKQIKYIQKIVKNHLYPSLLFSNDEIPSQKAKNKFFMRLENEVPDVIAVAYADRLCARGEKITEKIIQDNLSNLNLLLNEYFDIQKNLKPLPKLLDGNEIMEILNIEPSKNLRKIIEALREAQISEEITSKAQAIEFVKTFI